MCTADACVHGMHTHPCDESDYRQPSVHACMPVNIAHASSIPYGLMDSKRRTCRYLRDAGVLVCIPATSTATGRLLPRHAFMLHASVPPRKARVIHTGYAATGRDQLRIKCQRRRGCCPAGYRPGWPGEEACGQALGECMRSEAVVHTCSQVRKQGDRVAVPNCPHQQQTPPNLL